MKTMHLCWLIVMFALLSTLVVACEEDSDDEGTTDGDEDGDESDDDDDDDDDDTDGDNPQEDGDEDGDEETIDCLSLTEQQCAAHAEECWTYLARRYTLREDGCLFQDYPDGGTREFASCGSIPLGCEDATTNVLSPNNEFWHFGDYCIPEGWVNMAENDDICETRNCPTEPFCTGPIADGDTEEEMEDGLECYERNSSEECRDGVGCWGTLGSRYDALRNCVEPLSFAICYSESNPSSCGLGDMMTYGIDPAGNYWQFTTYHSGPDCEEASGGWVMCESSSDPRCDAFDSLDFSSLPRCSN